MCKLYQLMYRLFPFLRFRAFLINEHFLNCLRCQREEEISEALLGLLKTPDWINAEESMWPVIRKRHPQRKKEEELKLQVLPYPWLSRWRWAAASLMILLLFISIFIYRKGLQDKTEPEQLPQSVASTAGKATRIKINYAEIKGKKAISYIYQTPNASFVCFTQSKNSGG